MAYPEVCFTNLIGIRGVCEPKSGVYWLDDIPGIDLTRLANMAEQDAPTGEKLGIKLIESGARLMAADVEAIYDAQYKVSNTLVNGCSSCNWTGNYAAGPGKGILIKDNTVSDFSRLLLDKLTAKVNATGTFHIVIDDGAGNTRIIENDFLANYEYEFINLNYTTKQKTVKVFLQEDTVGLAQLSCPRGSGCGCNGSSAVVSDLVYAGLTDGTESQQAYGFKPCAQIRCDADDVLCYVAHSAPRMIGMALLYKVAELFFTSVIQSNRNNKVVGTKIEDHKEDIAKYSGLYLEKLNGEGTRGVKDLVFTTLQNSSDVCIICNSLVATAWATS